MREVVGSFRYHHPDTRRGQDYGDQAVQEAMQATMGQLRVGISLHSSAFESWNPPSQVQSTPSVMSAVVAC